LGRPGALGISSSHAANSDHLLIRTLANLRVGEVSKVVETPRGFVVLQRADLSSHVRHATSEILFTHGFSAGPRRGSARPRHAAAKLAGELSARLALEPRDFDKLSGEHCAAGACISYRSEWPQGARHPVLERRVIRLQFGEVDAEPIETIEGFHIVKREPLEGSPVTEGRLTFETPRPQPQSYATLLTYASGSYVAGLSLRGGQAFLRKTGMGEPTATRFRAVLESFASEVTSVGVPQREALVADLRRRLLVVLGPDSLASFEEFLDESLHQLQRNLE
jgi:hypothetical protein